MIELTILGRNHLLWVSQEIGSEQPVTYHIIKTAKSGFF